MPLDPMDGGMDSVEQQPASEAPLDSGPMTGLPGSIAPFGLFGSQPPGDPILSPSSSPVPVGLAVHRWAPPAAPATGAVDGTNTVFTTANIMLPGTETVLVNGLTAKNGRDYTVGVDLQTITFLYVLPIGTDLRIGYWVQ